MKLLAAAIVAALVSRFAVGLFDTAAVPDASLFAGGIVFGTIFGGLLVALYPTGEAKAESESATRSIYVGNLPFNVGKEEISNLFAPFGKVIEVRLVKDRRSRRFKGYAFVEMASAQALAAIEHLDNTDYAGRTLRVNEAKKREEG